MRSPGGMAIISRHFSSKGLIFGPLFALSNDKMQKELSPDFLLGTHNPLGEKATKKYREVHLCSCSA